MSLTPSAPVLATEMETTPSLALLQEREGCEAQRYCELPKATIHHWNSISQPDTQHTHITPSADVNTHTQTHTPQRHTQPTVLQTLSKSISINSVQYAQRAFVHAHGGRRALSACTRLHRHQTHQKNVILLKNKQHWLKAQSFWIQRRGRCQRTLFPSVIKSSAPGVPSRPALLNEF